MEIEEGVQACVRRVGAVHMAGDTSALNRARLDMANKEHVVMQSIGHDRREFISKSFCLAGAASLATLGESVACGSGAGAA